MQGINGECPTSEEIPPKCYVKSAHMTSSSQTYAVVFYKRSGARSNKHIRPKSVLNLKSREISFFHKTFLHCSITLIFCTEHGSYTAVICAKYQSDWTTIGDFMDERDFARFQFKTDSDRLGFIDTGPRSPY